MTTENIELWRPSPERAAATRLHAFRLAAAERCGQDLPDYAALHQWSIDRPEAFWPLLWDFCEIIAETRGDVVADEIDAMPGARYFPGARLNFAENLLRGDESALAILFRDEHGNERSLTRNDLKTQAAAIAAELHELGIGPGDRVAAITANVPEAIAGMLAAASIGAVWSSCSPDFGVQGILDRFEQIEPRVLLAVDGYYYNGKRHDVRDKVAAIRAAVPSIEHLILVEYAGTGLLDDSVTWADCLARHAGAQLDYASLPFNHPLYILFSSGTTGKPKCIVHCAGGALTQHLKEQQLHADIRRGDRVFYFTTCGWMMWNWLASVLASEATIMLYDGSPFAPDGYVLFDFAEAAGCTQFGTSAKFIQAIENFEVRPAERYTFAPLRTVMSTGSVLNPEGFDYVYAQVKADVCLSSMSGGTDIIACFVGGDPTGPVYRGELQCAALGMATEVWDEEGRSLEHGKGELVCTRSFPSMPLGFWGDDDGSRYRAAYFERFPGVWTHGDFAERTSHGGFVFYGRSDATLNPGGVRIGTSEIYRVVEQLGEVVECVAIGQDWEGDVRVVLFVVLHPGHSLDDDLNNRIKQAIKVGASPRHVPARVVQVSDIPRTRSGKITELAIRDIVHGVAIKNLEAIANPEAFDQFRDRAELAR